MAAPLLLLLIFAAMLISIEAGRRLRVKHLRAAAGESTGFGAVTGAVFALLGLMVAFTFSGAATRFDHRRDLIVEEANDIGTAYLRIGLLPEQWRAPLRDEFRAYVDSRLQTYRVGPDLLRVNELLQKTTRHQERIWSMSLEAIEHAPSPAVAAQILGPVNAMFDIVTTRTAATQMHPPGVVWAMLGGLTLVCALLAGYEMGAGAGRRWLHVLMFASIFATTLYVIIDMEYPRLGFIQVTAMDRLLQDVRDSME